ncbi:hypothetical protein [Profundibacterium mesophilum]|uniref:Alpha/beta hydrolase n=1 Tax=Profundibacterium mesophilum KAUST100406-0324 TaxID=1037889 RepID=A0A921TDY3_9RHOB|nr:hypothetical protein [Profundibacterium mesophilum]KAF0677293.1 hypothetical protein PMES_00340 [Profundibacterium mesophilum KAUST100406-0324]
MSDAEQRSITIEDLSRQLVTTPNKTRRQIYTIRSEGIDIPVRVIDVPGTGAADAPLVFVFHGGFNRAQPYPFFYGSRFVGRPDTAPRTVIALCDPTLALSDSLRFGWFAGAEGVDVPGAVRTLLAAFVAQIAPSRVIVTGGSIGAHAVLTHARELPGSMVVLANPLPRIDDYHQPSVREYFNLCWPGHPARAADVPQVVNDASLAYSDMTLHNEFVILLNATDPHIYRQAAPMLANLGGRTAEPERILPVSYFFPEHAGHAFPPDELTAWVDAAVMAPEPTARMAALTREKLRAGEARPARAKATRDDPLDIELAAQLVRATQEART